MTNKFIKKVLEAGIYDTRKYRYVVEEDITTRKIKRLPIYKLDTTAALNDWEIIYWERTAPAKKDEEPKETRRILSIVTTDELIANINRALQDTQNNARLISSIEDMEPFEARSGVYNPDNRVYRVRLIDYQDRHRNQLAQTLFRNQCASNGITIDRETRYSPDMRIYRITLDSIADMETVRGFEGVFSIEEAIPIRADMDAFDDMSVPAVKQPKSGVVYPVVGVLDSGIKKN